MFREQQGAPAEQLAEPESHPRVSVWHSTRGLSLSHNNSYGKFQTRQSTLREVVFCHVSRMDLLGMCTHILYLLVKQLKIYKRFMMLCCF